MSEKRLAEIEARAAAATPGPLKVRPNKHDDWGFVRDADGIPVLDCATSSFTGLWEREYQRRPVKTHKDWIAGPPQVAANAEFFAHAREDVPWLLEHCRKLQEKLDYAIQSHDEKIEENKSLRLEIARLQSDLEESRRAEKEAIESLVRHRDEIADLQKKLAERTAEATVTSEVFTATEAELEAIQEEVESLWKKNRDLNRRLQKAESDRDIKREQAQRDSTWRASAMRLQEELGKARDEAMIVKRQLIIQQRAFAETFAENAALKDRVRLLEEFWVAHRESLGILRKWGFVLCKDQEQFDTRTREMGIANNRLNVAIAALQASEAPIQEEVTT